MHIFLYIRKVAFQLFLLENIMRKKALLSLMGVSKRSGLVNVVRSPTMVENIRTAGEECC